MSESPIITLITDFGTVDPFAGIMKGVILGICPGARIVDLTHEVRAFEILDGAFVLAQSWRHFPEGTVHVCVVDPGVGSNRRPVLARAGGHWFVAPDNGVLSMVYAEEAGAEVRHLTNARYFREPVSYTFHGRDVFAPVAGHLAAGVAAAEFGEVVDDYMRLPFDLPVRTARRGWTGAVLKIDRFGNLVTNFKTAEFGHVHDKQFEMLVGLQAVERVERDYGSAGAGELFVIAGSSGYFEVSVGQGNAAKILGCGVGAPLELRLL